MKSAEALLTELQQLLAPLPYQRFDADAIYRTVSEKVEALRGLGVDELLLGSIDFQTRVMIGMDSGDPAGAAASVLNEIAVWKEENQG